MAAKTSLDAALAPIEKNIVNEERTNDINFFISIETLWVILMLKDLSLRIPFIL